MGTAAEIRLIQRSDGSPRDHAAAACRLGADLARCTMDVQAFHEYVTAWQEKGSGFTAHKGDFTEGASQNGLHSAPPRVITHYIKLILEWVCTKLSAVRTSHVSGPVSEGPIRTSHPGGSKSGGHVRTSHAGGLVSGGPVCTSHAGGAVSGVPDLRAERSSSGAGTARSNVPADAEWEWIGELWWLLGALLRCPGELHGPREAGMIVCAASEACAAVSLGRVACDLRAPLLCGVREALRGLHGVPGAAQPSLDDSVGLAVSVVELCISVPELVEGWELAGDVLSSLQRQCTLHPTQRKVFAAVTGRLLIPLVKLVFNDSSANSGRLVQARGTVADMGSGLLSTTLLHMSHMGGLAELCCAELLYRGAARAGPQSASKAGPVHRSHLWKLFETLEESLKRERGRNLRAPLAFLVWLQQNFVAALRRNRQQLSSSSVSTSGFERTPKGAATFQNDAHGAMTDRDADFNMFAVILSIMLARLVGAADGHLVTAEKRVTGKKRKHESARAAASEARDEGANTLANEAGEKDAESWSVLASGIADLLTLLKIDGIYRPTQDSSGAQQALLKEAGDYVINSYASPAAGIDSPGGPRAVAAARVVSAILAVEHRVLQPHLEQLWTILWAAAGFEGNGVATARQVACQLVGAYAELRQLDILLASLIRSLSSSSGGASCEAVICCAEFSSSLVAAMAGVPPGQVPTLVAQLARAIPCMAQENPTSQGNPPSQGNPTSRKNPTPHKNPKSKGSPTARQKTPAASEESPSASGDPLRGPRGGPKAGCEGIAPLCLLLTTCLGSFPVTSATAVPLASALEKLVADDLAAHLACQLAVTVQADMPLGGRGGALLALYTTSLETHARCVGTNPAITPVLSPNAAGNSPRAPPQISEGTHLASHPLRSPNATDDPPRNSPQTSEGGFFYPLERAGLRVPSLQDIGEAGFGGEAGRKPGACDACGPRLQWARAVLYALNVGRESALRCRFTCDADGEFPEGGDADMAPAGKTYRTLADMLIIDAITPLGPAPTQQATAQSASSSAASAQVAAARVATAQVTPSRVATAQLAATRVTPWDGYSADVTEEHYKVAILDLLTQQLPMVAAWASPDNLIGFLEAAFLNARVVEDTGGDGRDSGVPTRSPTEAFQDTVHMLATSLEAMEDVTIQEIWAPAATKALWASLDNLLGFLGSARPPESGDPMPRKHKKAKTIPGFSIRARVEEWKALQIEDPENAVGLVVAQALESVREGGRERDVWREQARQRGVSDSLQRVTALCDLLSHYAAPLVGDRVGELLVPLIASQACLLTLLPQRAADLGLPPSPLPNADSPQRAACAVVDALASSQRLMESLHAPDTMCSSDAHGMVADDLLTWAACLCGEAGRAVRNTDTEGRVLPSLKQGLSSMFESFGGLAYAASCCELASMHCREVHAHNSETQWRFSWEGSVDAALTEREIGGAVREWIQGLMLEAQARAFYKSAAGVPHVSDAQRDIMAGPEDSPIFLREATGILLDWQGGRDLVRKFTAFAAGRERTNKDAGPWEGFMGEQAAATLAGGLAHYIQFRVRMPRTSSPSMQELVEDIVKVLPVAASMLLGTGRPARGTRRLLPAGACLRLVSFLEATALLVPCLMAEDVQEKWLRSTIALHFALLRDVCEYPKECAPLHHAVSFSAAFPSLSACKGDRVRIRLAVLLSFKALFSRLPEEKRSELLVSAQREVVAPASPRALLAALELFLLAAGATADSAITTLPPEGQRPAQRSETAEAHSPVQRNDPSGAHSPAQRDEAAEARSPAHGIEPPQAHSAAHRDAFCRAIIDGALLAGQNIGKWAQESEPDVFLPVACTALKSVESVLGQSGRFRLASGEVLQFAGLPAKLLSLGGEHGVHPALFSGLCSVLVAAVRHRPRQLVRGVWVLLGAIRALLPASFRALQRGDGSASLQMSKVYSAVHEAKEYLRPYCHVLVAEYVVELEACTLRQEWQSQEGGGAAEPSGMPLGSALREGIYAVFGCCTPTEVQHIFSTFEKGKGDNLRTALTKLQQEYEKLYRYTGKV